MTKHCCEMMRLQVEQTCTEHGNNCPDIVIGLFKNGPFFLPVHEGGGSGIAINNCPWCGALLERRTDRRIPLINIDTAGISGKEVSKEVWDAYKDKGESCPCDNHPAALCETCRGACSCHWVQTQEPDLFVPDFFRCNACGNVSGDHFRYDPNPKGLPAIETPVFMVDFAKQEQRVADDAVKVEAEAEDITPEMRLTRDPADPTGLIAEYVVDPVQEQGPIDLGDGGPPVNLRSFVKPADFTPDAEQRARGWAGTGPRRGVLQRDDGTIVGPVGGLYANAVATGHLPVAAEGLFDQMKLKGVIPQYDVQVAINQEDPTAVDITISIAELFGCARTGEEGAVYCAKCRSYDVDHVSEVERNKVMLELCEHYLEIDWWTCAACWSGDHEHGRPWMGAPGDYSHGAVQCRCCKKFHQGVSPSKLEGEADFLATLRSKATNSGFGSFSDAEVSRLYKNYKKLTGED